MAATSHKTRTPTKADAALNRRSPARGKSGLLGFQGGDWVPLEAEPMMAMDPVSQLGGVAA